VTPRLRRSNTCACVCSRCYALRSSLPLIRAGNEHSLKRSDYPARIFDVREQRCLCLASWLWSLSCGRNSDRLGDHAGSSSPSCACARRRESIGLGNVVLRPERDEPGLFSAFSGISDLRRRTPIHIAFLHRARRRGSCRGEETSDGCPPYHSWSGS
jgi:hypothetical protein